MAVKHENYLATETRDTNIKDPLKPIYIRDSRGRLIQPLPGYAKRMLSVEPGSKVISQGTEDEAGLPNTDPNSIRTGTLHADTVITIGNTIRLSGKDSIMSVGIDPGVFGPAFIIADDHLLGTYNSDIVFGFFLTKYNDEFDAGDFLIGNAGGQYIHYDQSEGLININADIAVGGDLQSSNYVAGVSGYFLDYDTGNAYFNSVTVNNGVIDGNTTIAGRDASTIAGTIDAGGNITTTIGGRDVSTVAGAISAVGELITSNLNTATRQILDEFTFGSSGAIAIENASNTGVWISPAGIIGRTSGTTTFALTSAGSATFRGSISASTFQSGTITGGSIDGVVITGGTIRTASGTTRVEMNSLNYIRFYYSGIRRIQLDTQFLRFYNTAGTNIGVIYGGSDTNFNIEAPYGNYLMLACGSPYVIYFKCGSTIVGYFRQAGLAMMSGADIVSDYAHIDNVVLDNNSPLNEDGSMYSNGTSLYVRLGGSWRTVSYT